MNILRPVLILTFALAMLVCGDRITFAADAKPPGQKQLSAEDKLSVREAQVVLARAQSQLQQVIQQAQQELTTAQEALQKIVQALEKKCGAKVNEITGDKGKSELVCTAGETSSNSEAPKR